MKKIFINIFLIILCFFAADIYYFYQNPFGMVKCAVKDLPKNYIINLFRLENSSPNIGQRIETYNKDTNDKVIITSGCSFMRGLGLKKTETLPSLLADITKKPVLDASIPGGSLNTLLYLIQKGHLEKKINSFKNPNPEILVYLYGGGFHADRLIYGNHFLEPEMFFYKIKKGKLELQKPPFFICRSAFLFVTKQRIHQYLTEHNIYYRNYVKNFLKMHFLTVKEELENKYPDIKFVIIVYLSSPLFEETADELTQKGFYILRMEQDFNIDFTQEGYVLPDGHPSALIWEQTAEPIALKLQQIMQQK